MECCGRPNRSDMHLSREEEAKMEEQTRHHFDSIAPKRHSKPQRSDYSSTYVDAFTDKARDGDLIPEHAEFQRLENDSQKLVSDENQDSLEFVETEYYKDLGCVDKQHHTIGTGFIKMENSNTECFALGPDSASDGHASCRGNPATNDWIPAAADPASFASDKPNRSEN